MSDDDRTKGLFMVPPNAPPRSGPTMAAVLELLTKLLELAGQILKRQQQTALMVDGVASAVNKRFDVLHTETALLRVAINRPKNDTDSDPNNVIPIHVEAEAEPVEEPKKLTPARAAVLTGKVLSYGTSAAIALRLLGKVFPEYQAAIDGLLGLFGL